jgi:hypothetical protein
MGVKLAVAMLVWHFDVELAEEGQREPVYEDGFFTIRGPLLVQLTAVH